MGILEMSHTSLIFIWGSVLNRNYHQFLINNLHKINRLCTEKFQGKFLPFSPSIYCIIIIINIYSFFVPFLEDIHRVRPSLRMQIDFDPISFSNWKIKWSSSNTNTPTPDSKPIVIFRCNAVLHFDKIGHAKIGEVDSCDFFGFCDTIEAKVGDRLNRLVVIH